MEKLITTRMGFNPNERKLGELATLFGIVSQDGLALSSAEYRQMIEEDTLIRDEKDLTAIHQAIRDIRVPKIKNELEQQYGKLLTQ
jgi:hypothetical protein